MKRILDWLAEPIECPWWAALLFLLALALSGATAIKWLTLAEQSISDQLVRDVIH